jgi:hypothetical protein
VRAGADGRAVKKSHADVVETDVFDDRGDHSRLADLRSAKSANTIVNASPATAAKIVDQPSAIRIPPPYIGWRTSR